ncbi:DNA gyrase/topoisomerase IV subunit A [Flavobacteriales bacterium]|jgi:topoisomerase-4 subunit A|nr:DNA gyrase/topoisomerase IV subunit A [Flavobacteriales bacterium]MDG1176072.1 DNA gyrase/topoisomerase IV subunit A [Flavobacteriales bacterium]
MAEEELENINPEENNPEGEDTSNQNNNIISVSGMYKDWFLDYASYVILERAVPSLEDGLKPVQRRILHSMKEMDDGRYNKVANIIGNTMKYHPHGDASIGDALVQLGQKELLIDMQGNWGNTLTGDRAAAARYIEARLSKFGLEVVFNGKTTEWVKSYDGRNKEPVNLPVKFPLLLAQGAEGIAVGLSTKILPHNFIELIDASIRVLQGKKTNILPDFLNGGMADFTDYNEGMRGGKIRVRAKIRKEDAKTLIVHEIPFGTNTSNLIDSIVKANDKGKIKIKKVEDNTAAEVEIVIHLPAGISPDKTIDALYAFTDCQISVSPNACIIEDNTPKFIGVNQMLKNNTDDTVRLLKMELDIKLAELNEQWHYSSLEKIFIENKIYIDFDGKTYEEAIEVTHKLLKPHIKHLLREVTNDDVIRLLEIKMRRITKHDGDKADNYISSLEDQIKEVKEKLNNLIEYAIEYFKNLKKKYGAGKERRTEIRTFDQVDKTKVIVSNKKLYVNREEGFAGYGLKKDEFVQDCSEISDIIVFRRDGVMLVSKASDKHFFGKDILHIAVWKKGDKRTIYHMIYQDGSTGASYMKRFNVTSITRDKEYDMTKGTKGSKVHYFTANPNGEGEIVQVALRPRPSIKKLKIDIDFAELIVKGRASNGNRVTKNLISKVTQKEQGDSTLSARKLWYDDIVRKLNVEGRGEYLGDFKGDDRILMITQAGEYRLYPFDLNIHFADDMIHIEKWNPDKPMSVIYWDGDKEYYYVKRFLLEDSDKPVVFISEHPKSHLEIASTDWKPVVNLQFDGRVNKRDNEEVVLEEFIAVKGMKALGNRLTTYKVKSIDVLDSIPFEPEPTPEPEVKEEVIAEETVPETKEEAPKADANSGEDKKPPPPPKSIDDDGQASLF